MSGKSAESVTSAKTACGIQAESRGGDEQHLVGHCVLVGELPFARQVLVHRWNDLQDVVVRGQSCSGNNNNNITQT